MANQGPQLIGCLYMANKLPLAVLGTCRFQGHGPLIFGSMYVINKGPLKCWIRNLSEVPALSNSLYHSTYHTFSNMVISG